MKIVAKYVDDPLSPLSHLPLSLFILLIYVLFRSKISIVLRWKLKNLSRGLNLPKPGLN